MEGRRLTEGDVGGRTGSTGCRGDSGLVEGPGIADVVDSREDGPGSSVIGLGEENAGSKGGSGLGEFEVDDGPGVGCRPLRDEEACWDSLAWSSPSSVNV